MGTAGINLVRNVEVKEAAVLASGSPLRDIHDIGPAGATRILADVGDIARFPNRNHFASSRSATS